MKSYKAFSTKGSFAIEQQRTRELVGDDFGFMKSVQVHPKLRRWTAVKAITPYKTWKGLFTFDTAVKINIMFSTDNHNK